MDPILNRFGYDEFREGQKKSLRLLKKGMMRLRFTNRKWKIVYLSIYWRQKKSAES